MKHLIECLMESRGIVTGKNDWTGLCKYIEGLKYDDSFQLSQIGNNSIKQLVITQHLPQWINKVTLCIPITKEGEFSLLGGGLACVLTEYVKTINNKVDNVYICFNKSEVEKNGFKTNILQHELQHVYDQYISKGKIINDKFKLRVLGDPWAEDDSFYDIVSKNNFSVNSVFDLFSEFTEFGHNVEIAAYLREFSLFLSKWDKSELKYQDLVKKENVDDSGAAPLMLYKAFITLFNKYKSLNLDDINYIISNLNSQQYFKRVCKKQFNITGYEGFEKILNWFIRIGLAPIKKRYIRVAEDHNIKLIDIFK